MEGRIIRELAGFYYVFSAETKETYQCRAKGIFRKKGIRPSVGDIVSFSLTNTDDVEGSVDIIHERKNILGRPPVANVDRVLIVFSGHDPDPNFLLCDRFLVMLEKKDIPAGLCFNKADITDEDELLSYADIYSKAGYQTFITSTVSGEGKEELLSFFRGQLTAMTGPSGVGKSSIMNMLTGSDSAETGEVSKKTGHGKQTTRASSIYPIEGGDTFVIDTPGFGSLDLSGIEKEELYLLFPEMRRDELVGRCRFSGCSHISEPGCAVREAVSKGEIAEIRYENYIAIFRDLSAERKY